MGCSTIFIAYLRTAKHLNLYSPTTADNLQATLILAPSDFIRRTAFLVFGQFWGPMMIILELFDVSVLRTDFGVIAYSWKAVTALG